LIQKYATQIAESTDFYGTALIYYALSRKAKKVKDVLDLLISISLVQSRAYPPISKLDRSLRDLILNPRYAMSQITRIDTDAAEILRVYLSGYATLRKFYEIRDEGIPEDGATKAGPSLQRRQAAASVLLTVIASAASNIRGGLYDIKSDAVIQVDGLLALLGEAMVFVDRSYDQN
jgi:hypothetical protein